MIYTYKTFIQVDKQQGNGQINANCCELCLIISSKSSWLESYIQTTVLMEIKKKTEVFLFSILYDVPKAIKVMLFSSLVLKRRISSVTRITIQFLGIKTNAQELKLKKMHLESM